MGISYCAICFSVVSATIRLASQDPPFGFPGAEGILEKTPRPSGPSPEKVVLLPSRDALPGERVLEGSGRKEEGGRE